MTRSALLPAASDVDLGEVLETAAPPVSRAQASEIARAHFGVDGIATPMTSERDHNFRISTADGPSFVLKISHPAEDPAVVDFQISGLNHIARVAPDLPVPRVVPATGGTPTALIGGGTTSERIARLLTFMPGRLLQDAAPDPALDGILGVLLARLGRALRGFFHPAAGTDLLWDIRKISAAGSLLESVANPGTRAAIHRVIDDYHLYAMPALPKLRAQVVHNDMSRSNVVLDEQEPRRVSGVIDFGDMMHAPLICDVAVGASYRWSPGEHPLAGAARFVAGYRSNQTLEDEEIAVLFDLIKARLALVCAVVNWQAERFPEKRDYVMRWQTEIADSLLSLAEVSRSEAQDVLLSAS